MTCTTYDLIAKTLSDVLDDHDHDLQLINGIAGVERATRAVAEALQRDNPSFDTERFLEACKLEEA